MAGRQGFFAELGEFACVSPRRDCPEPGGCAWRIDNSRARKRLSGFVAAAERRTVAAVFQRVGMHFPPHRVFVEVRTMHCSHTIRRDNSGSVEKRIVHAPYQPMARSSAELIMNPDGKHPRGYWRQLLVLSLNLGFRSTCVFCDQ